MEMRVAEKRILLMIVKEEGFKECKFKREMQRKRLRGEGVASEF